MKSTVRVKGAFGGIYNLEMTVAGDMKTAAEALEHLLKSHMKEDVELKPGFIENQLFDEERIGSYYFYEGNRMVTVSIREHRFE